MLDDIEKLLKVLTDWRDDDNFRVWQASGLRRAIEGSRIPMMKNVFAVLALAAGCFAATPPNISGVPGAAESQDTKVRLFATVYHYISGGAETDDITFQISTDNKETASFAATLVYETNTGSIKAVTLPTVQRSKTWPITYTGCSLTDFKRLISATVQEMASSSGFKF